MWWLELVRILRISAGVSGRCCHFAFSYSNRLEGHVPELSLGFCATGINGVQLPGSCPRLNPALQEMVQDHPPVGIQVGHFNPMNLGSVVLAHHEDLISPVCLGFVKRLVCPVKRCRIGFTWFINCQSNAESHCWLIACNFLLDFGITVFA